MPENSSPHTQNRPDFCLGHLSNVLIDSYAKCGLLEDALKVSSLDRWFKPDHFVFASLIKACASLSDASLGQEVHARSVVSRFSDEDVVKSSLVDIITGEAWVASSLLGLALGYDSLMFVSNALIDMYAICSDLSDVKKNFDGMWERDLVSWTLIIVGMTQHGRAREALALYDKMILAGLKLNEVTFVGLIYACSHVGLVERGHLNEAEDLLIRTPFQPDEAVWTALLSAYKRHGNTAWEPGYSWIDLGKESLVSYAGESFDFMKDEIYHLLKETDAEMRKRGYVTDICFYMIWSSKRRKGSSFGRLSNSLS
ncbi:hypothetical protein ACH5RR_031845 [Cinchona calisaya]|uniref:Pentatricopeptide repeat-containing protein n=1 Tax=Cinchona calisaya TaxID=153742 RepID=A0ABD2YLP7_9GENT